MNRADFDKLEILEQINYINTKLDTGATITNICKDIGIGRTTIRDRFKKYLYEYNKELNQYKSIVEVVDPMDEVCITIEPKQKSSNKVVEAEQVNNKLLENIAKEYKDMNNKYTTMNKKLEEMYLWYELQSSNKVVTMNKLELENFEGEIVTRSFKLYEPIQKEFMEYCANSKYKVQDLLSQAIREFLDKYNIED